MVILSNIDNLGRVVIPSNLLENLGLKKGEQVVVFEEDNKIKILKIEPNNKKL